MPASLFRTAAFVTLTAFAGAAPGFAQTSLSGAYLAARHASMFSDFEAAGQYYTRALSMDPFNLVLLDDALVSYIGQGNVDRAAPLARRILQLGDRSQTAQMTVMAQNFEREAFDVVLEDLEAGASVSPLVDGMLRAWALYGQGDISAALDAFDQVGIESGLSDFSDYHKALVLASVGDFEGAIALFEGEEALSYASARVVLAHVQILSQLGRNPEAIEIVHKVFGANLDPALEGLVVRLEQGDAIPFDIAQDAREGAAEVFYSVAGALNGEASPIYTLIYARLTQFLRPTHDDAILMVGALLEDMEQFPLAARTYAQVPTNSHGYYEAEIGRASALEQQGKTDAAIEVLKQLTKTHGNIATVHVTLGDMYRREEAFDDATRSYDRALELFEGEAPEQWFIYYARGITHEREGRWPQAEADFRKALDLNPDQPQVLNYLGYSMVEMRTNLEEALQMIETAVALRPDDGYITDSLGWGLYRLGRYGEAVEYMERAVELEPIDPIVNDHLGDVLWAVGRRVEAAFQWRRALSFIDPDDVPVELDPDRIRSKLENGLDAVLAAEGADPLKVADGN